MRALNRRFKDSYGVPVRVIRWEPETQRVIYLRDGYERPIVINPDLAYSIGLNEAIALQQINYWLQETKSGMESDGVRWIYNTTEQWLEQFPFWSEST
ncbi:DUF4222 domain-containing protein, partial [Citrobacter freundii]